MEGSDCCAQAREKDVQAREKDCERISSRAAQAEAALADAKQVQSWSALFGVRPFLRACQVLLKKWCKSSWADARDLSQPCHNASAVNPLLASAWALCWKYSKGRGALRSCHCSCIFPIWFGMISFVAWEKMVCKTS